MSKKPRPEHTEGPTYRIKTGCGWLYVTLGLADGKPFELFTQIGKSGGCATSQCQAIGMLVSEALQWGVPLERIQRKLTGIRCHLAHMKVLSCADGIAQTLTKMKEYGVWAEKKENSDL